MKRFIGVMFLAALLLLAACQEADGEAPLEKIVLADAGWDSIQVHNYIAKTIIEEGYGYDTDIITGSSSITFQGMIEGDIQVYMEVWTQNMEPAYQNALDAEEIIELSTNFNDNVQGLYVPTYVIEGDEERGIEAVAPDLRTVEDLKDYPHIFTDPENPKRGRIVNAAVDGSSSEYITEKFATYGLDETMNNFIPGSVPAIDADLIHHYEKGEPWVGYYWSPTWITAKYDLTLLEEPAYDPEIWEKNRGTAFPPNDVTIAAHIDLPEQAPEVVAFLKNYETSNELTEAALVYMVDEEATAEETAQWWLEEYTEVWTEWVPEDIAQKVKDSLF